MGLMGKVAHLRGEFGENSAGKGILCDSISLFIHFSVILCIIYHGIDVKIILAHKSEHFTSIFPHLIRNCMLKIKCLQSPLFADLTYSGGGIGVWGGGARARWWRGRGEGVMLSGK